MSVRSPTGGWEQMGSGGAASRDVVGLLALRDEGAGRFVASPHVVGGRRVVEGSQIFAQTLMAAARLVPGRRPVSAWMGFVRVADASLELDLELTELSNGRTFSAFRVEARQGDRCCASGNVLLDATAPDLVRHQVDPVTVAGPDDCPQVDLGVAGQEVRVVDGAYTGDRDAPAGPPEIDAWVRVPGAPDDAATGAALLAHFCGSMSIAAALRPHPGHGQDDAHQGLSTAVNAISLSLHAPVRADRWMLYQHRSTFAGDGMTHSECRVHDESGALLASFSVDAMVRAAAPVGVDSARVL